MLNVTVLSNKFGRVTPGSNILHAVSVGFKITGAVSGTPTFEKRINGGTWLPFNTDHSWNKDGYITQWFLPPHTYDFSVREVGYEGDVTNITNYNAVADLESHGLHSVGSTPKILNTVLEVGSNKTLTIKTIEPNQVVRLYASVLDSGEEKFNFNDPILIEGVSDTDGIFVASIPTVRNNQKFYPTAQGTYELESIAGNGIIAGLTVGAVQQQLDINISVGSATGAGRPVTVTVTGGSGNYSIAKDRLSGFNYLPNQSFELAFGRKYVIVKDNSTGVVFSKAIHIISAGQQTIVDLGLRSNFSNAANPTGNWTYGYINKNDNVFTAFDNYGTRDGKSAWGKTSYQLPLVGYGGNTYPLDVNAIALVPHTLEQGSSIGFGETQAVAKYTFANAGIFNTTNFKVKKPTPGSIGATTFYLKYIVKFNDVILYQGVLDGFGEELQLSIQNLSVQSGDVISIIADAANDSDTSSPDHDELHVIFEGQLSTSTYVAPTAPTAPILAVGTGASTSTINQGTSIKVLSSPATNWISLFKNGYLVTMFETTQVVADYVYEYFGGVSGTYNAKSVASGVYSSSATSNFLVQASVLPSVSAPVIITASPLSIGQTVVITCSSVGSLYIYKDAAYLAAISIDTIGNVNYTPTATGSYTFKIFRSGVLSAASGTMVINSGSTDCSAFVNDFVLGSIMSRPLKVYDVNGHKVIKEVIDANTFSIKNANFLKLETVTSVYKAYTSCFGFANNNFITALTQSNIGNINGYTWSYTQDGMSTPILILNTSQADVYRIIANTDCSGKRILFAYSATVSNPSLIPDSSYLTPDGITKVNTLGIEDVNGKDSYYKELSLAPGVYNFFYKVEGSPNTPVTVVNKVIS